MFERRACVRSCLLAFLHMSCCLNFLNTIVGHLAWSVGTPALPVRSFTRHCRRGERRLGVRPWPALCR